MNPNYFNTTMNAQSSVNCLCNPHLSRFEEYSAYHSNLINKIIHFITIPIIVTTMCHFLDKLHLVYDDESLLNRPPRLDVNYSSRLLSIAQLFYCVYYFTWSWTVGFTMMFYLEFAIQAMDKTQKYLMDKFKSRFIVNYIVFAISVSAWVFQFVGHYIEGRRPALVDNLSTAFLTAPMFSLSFLFNM